MSFYHLTVVLLCCVLLGVSTAIVRRQRFDKKMALLDLTQSKIDSLREDIAVIKRRIPLEAVPESIRRVEFPVRYYGAHDLHTVSQLSMSGKDVRLAYLTGLKRYRVNHVAVRELEKSLSFAFLNMIDDDVHVIEDLYTRRRRPASSPSSYPVLDSLQEANAGLTYCH